MHSRSRRQDATSRLLWPQGNKSESVGSLLLIRQERDAKATATCNFHGHVNCNIAIGFRTARLLQLRATSYEASEGVDEMIVVWVVEWLCRIDAALFQASVTQADRPVRGILAANTARQRPTSALFARNGPERGDAVCA